MLILMIRTDKPEAEIGLYNDQQQLAYEVWQAHRQLAETIHQKIHHLLTTQGRTLSDIGGIVCFKGPGSFTGLRIGLSVGNALAYSLAVPIVAAEEEWVKQGIDRLLAGKSDVIALPEYGSPVYTTLPRK